MNKQEHFIQHGAVKIHCIECNRQENSTPLIIVPGATNSAEDMEEAFDGKLTGHHLIVSLRGRGQSDAPTQGYSLNDHASDVVAVIDHFKLQNCFIFGYSLGSTVGVRAASQKSEVVKGLIMGDYPPHFPPHSAAWAESVLANPENSMSKIAIDALVAEAKHEQAAGDFQKINCPCLFIKGGKKGSLFPREQLPILHQIIQNLTIEILEESDHDIFSPSPDKLVEVLNGFMAS